MIQCFLFSQTIIRICQDKRCCEFRGDRHAVHSRKTLSPQPQSVSQPSLLFRCHRPHRPTAMGASARGRPQCKTTLGDDAALSPCPKMRHKYATTVTHHADTRSGCRGDRHAALAVPEPRATAPRTHESCCWPAWTQENPVLPESMGTPRCFNSHSASARCLRVRAPRLLVDDRGLAVAGFVSRGNGFFVSAPRCQHESTYAFQRAFHLAVHRCSFFTRAFSIHFNVLSIGQSITSCSSWRTKIELFCGPWSSAQDD